MPDCSHWWTYCKGRSVCILCREEADDTRGLPHGTVAINGDAMRPTDVARDFCCPICSTNLAVIVADGRLKIACVNGHDIGALGRAEPIGRRNRRRALDIEARMQKRVYEIRGEK